MKRPAPGYHCARPAQHALQAGRTGTAHRRRGCGQRSTAAQHHHAHFSGPHFQAVLTEAGPPVLLWRPVGPGGGREGERESTQQRPVTDPASPASADTPASMSSCSSLLPTKSITASCCCWLTLRGCWAAARATAADKLRETLLDTRVCKQQAGRQAQQKPNRIISCIAPDHQRLGAHWHQHLLCAHGSCVFQHHPQSQD